MLRLISGEASSTMSAASASSSAFVAAAAAGSYRLKTRLYDYQDEVVRNAVTGGKIVAASMGTGKTLMMLGIFVNNPVKTLIITPTAVTHHIYDQAIKHVAGIAGRVHIYQGDRRNSPDNLRKFAYSQIIITTYPTLVAESKSKSVLFDTVFGTLFLDEAHIIRNMKTVTHRLCCSLRITGQRWCMTGTPIHNSVQDLVSLAVFMGESPQNDPRWWSRATSEDRSGWMDDRLIVITEEDAGLELPEPHFHEHEDAMEAEQLEIYNAVRLQAASAVRQFLGREIKFGSVLALITRLKQAAIHPLAMTDKWETHPEKTSNKFSRVWEIVEELPEGEKIVIVSQYTRVLQMLTDSLGESVCLFTGDMTSSERERSLAEFRREGGPRIMLLSLLAGGVGIDLTCANHMIMMDPWWTQAAEDQAFGRIHRIGQTRETHLHRLKTENSLESWICALQARKHATALDLLHGYQAGGPSAEDVVQLYQTHLRVVGAPAPPRLSSPVDEPVDDEGTDAGTDDADDVGDDVEVTALTHDDDPS